VPTGQSSPYAPEPSIKFESGFLYPTGATMKQKYITTEAFPEPNHTQTPNDFFEMLPDMESSEVRVSLVMIRQTYGFHRGSFKMGIGKLADAAGLSRGAAKDGAEAAEKRGTFRRSNPDELGEAEWELVIGQPVEGSTSGGEMVNQWRGGSQPLTDSTYTKESIKEKKEIVLSEKELQQVNAKVDAIIAGGQDQTQLDSLHDFERIFGFGSLPWYSNTAWDKFAKWIIKQGCAWFADYVQWRNGDGKYKAFSNKKIRENPAAFIDTGYPEYEASKMYRKTDEDRGVYAPQIGV
jgi:hypothetical protein